jgi:ribosomal protein L11 methyltransferase
MGLEEELPHLVASSPTLGIEIEESGGDVVGAAIYAESAEADALSRLAGVLDHRGASNLRIETFRMQDWLQGYRDAVRPFAVGDRWWIDPHPDEPSIAPDDRRRLVIEPRMAFGSGSHESTRLMLMALEGLEVAGADVLDVGTGSGILALAAESLGARRVVALDIDETAIWVARQIRAQQEWSPRVQFFLGPLTCIGAAQFQVVLCNMISSNFQPLLDEMSRVLAADGHIILAGLLAAEIDTVTGALSSAGLETRGRRVLGEWASLSATAAAR